MPTLSYKAVGFELAELKARDDGWHFSGYASTFGNIDEGGDVVQRGAFTKSLQVVPHPKLLWQHDMGEPIGRTLSLREDDRGLYGEFKISRTRQGEDAYTLLKDGAIDSMSIGYIPDDQELDEKTGIRQLKAVSLLEVSVVSLPMNTQALITTVKSATQRNPDVVAQLQALLRDIERPPDIDAPKSRPDLGVLSITKMRVALKRKELLQRRLLELA